MSSDVVLVADKHAPAVRVHVHHVRGRAVVPRGFNPRRFQASPAAVKRLDHLGGLSGGGGMRWGSEVGRR